MGKEDKHLSRSVSSLPVSMTTPLVATPAAIVKMPPSRMMPAFEPRSAHQPMGNATRSIVMPWSISTTPTSVLVCSAST